MKRSVEQQKTFENLQKSTMSLIGAFYEMPSDVKEFFADMVAVYEANPTEENAKLLSDKVMGRDDAAAKKEWMKAEVAKVPSTVRALAKKKYIDEKQAVPKSIPTSGMVMTGLNVVSRNDKDALMEAQAAARILAAIENPNSIDLKKELVAKDKDGNLAEPKAFLDKPFSTKIQRLEHLSAILAGYQKEKATYEKAGATNLSTVEKAQEELEKEAVFVLHQAANQLSKTSMGVSMKVSSLANVYAFSSSAMPGDLEKVNKAMQDVLPAILSWHDEGKLTEAEKKIASVVVTKRIEQVIGKGAETEKTKEPEKKPEAPKSNDTKTPAGKVLRPSYHLTGKNMDVNITINSLRRNGGR